MLRSEPSLYAETTACNQWEPTMRIIAGFSAGIAVHQTVVVIGSLVGPECRFNCR